MLFLLKWMLLRKLFPKTLNPHSKHSTLSKNASGLQMNSKAIEQMFYGLSNLG